MSFRPGDKVRVKRVLGGINSEDWQIMAEVQEVDSALPMPLDEDEDHQSVTVKNFPYMLSSDDLVLVESNV